MTHRPKYAPLVQRAGRVSFGRQCKNPEQADVPLQGHICGGCNLRRTVKEFSGHERCAKCRKI